MRKLTAETFNTPATAGEIAETLAAMERQQHVNANIVRTWQQVNPYVLTLGKLAALASTSLYVNVKTMAMRLGVEVTHQKAQKISCGCCTCGAVCAIHQDIPRGRPARSCEHPALTLAEYQDRLAGGAA